jgi:hypothetical protein
VLDALILACLEKDPQRRATSTQELLVVLGALAEQAGPPSSDGHDDAGIDEHYFIHAARSSASTSRGAPTAQGGASSTSSTPAVAAGTAAPARAAGSAPLPVAADDELFHVPTAEEAAPTPTEPDAPVDDAGDTAADAPTAAWTLPPASSPLSSPSSSAAAAGVAAVPVLASMATTPAVDAPVPPPPGEPSRPSDPAAHVEPAPRARPLSVPVAAAVTVIVVAAFLAWRSVRSAPVEVLTASSSPPSSSSPSSPPPPLPPPSSSPLPPTPSPPPPSSPSSSPPPPPAAPGPQDIDVTFVSVPEGAEVWVGPPGAERSLGVTPHVHRFAAGAPGIRVKFTRPGFRDAVRTVRPSPGAEVRVRLSARRAAAPPRKDGELINPF